MCHSSSCQLVSTDLESNSLRSSSFSRPLIRPAGTFSHGARDGGAGKTLRVSEAHARNPSPRGDRPALSADLRGSYGAQKWPSCCRHFRPKWAVIIDMSQHGGDVDDSNQYGDKKAVLRIRRFERIRASGWNWVRGWPQITERESWRRKLIAWTWRP